MKELIKEANLIPVNQQGFQPKKSTIPPLLYYIHLLKWAQQTKNPLITTFIDFKKAFDSINHDTLIQILIHMEFPEKTTNIKKNILENSNTKIETGIGFTENFL